MQCARNAGCVPVLIGAAAAAEFSEHPPSLVFDDCNGLFLNLQIL